MTSGAVVGPIDWGAHDGALVERAFAVMLLQCRAGWRRQSSRGDGGVDIAYPTEGGYAVDQIKSFTGALRGNRKKQIEESLKRVVEDSGLPGPVTLWRLVMPMDPSREAEKWFRELTAAVGFPCEWQGLTFVDGLASENTHVVDYYFRDGKQLLEERLRDLANAAELLSSATVPARVAEASSGLLALYETVNRTDPHFRYEFEVTETMPSLEDADRPGCVMLHSVGKERGPCVITRVFERYPRATDDRPIPVSFSALLTDDIEGADRLRDDMRRVYEDGDEAFLPVGTVTDLTVDAPGGLGVSGATGASVRIIGLNDETFEPFRFRLAVTDPTDLILAETQIEALDRKKGTKRATVRFKEVNGAFTVTLKAGIGTDGQPSMTFGKLDPDPCSAPAARIQPGIRLLDALRRPNTLRLLSEHGDGEGSWFKIDQDEAPIAPQLVRLVDAVAAIQSHTSTALRVPEELTRSDYTRIIEAGRLARGEPSAGRWTQLRVEMEADSVDQFLSTLTAPGVALQQRYVVVINGVEVDLGECHSKYYAIGSVDTEPGDDEMVWVNIHPGDDTRYEVVPGPIPRRD